MNRDAAIALLDRLHAAQGAFYAGGASAGLRDLLTDDVRWSVPGTSPIAGTHEGVDATLDYFARRRDLAAGTLELHRGDVLVGDGDTIAALTDGTAELGGTRHRWSTVGLYDVRDGRIAACWLLPLDAGLFDRIWSP